MTKKWLQILVQNVGSDTSVRCTLDKQLFFINHDLSSIFSFPDRNGFPQFVFRVERLVKVHMTNEILPENEITQ